MSGYDVVDGSPQRHRSVTILSNGNLKTDAILAFAERLLLANNGH